jgi:hypothetical protein
LTQSGRKLAGTLATLLSLIVYPLVVMEAYTRWLMPLPGWAAVLVLGLCGLLWVVPAALIVRWMSRPD